MKGLRAWIITLERLKTVKTDRFRGWMSFDQHGLKNGTMSKFKASTITPVSAPLLACLLTYELEYSSNQLSSWATDSSMRFTETQKLR